jgi:hypothetical protein
MNSAFRQPNETIMMNLRSLLSLPGALLLFLLAGCSSTPTKVDTGPIEALTFNFIKTSSSSLPSYSDRRDVIHPMIQKAITKSLAAKGLNRAIAGADVTVAYLIIVGNNATTQSIDDYFGYGNSGLALHEKAHEAYTSSKNPNHFDAGTLVIDIIDSKTFKLLKRGYATRPLLRNLPDDARAERIQEVVDEILKDVRIKQ